MKGRGNTSWKQYPKKGYNIKFSRKQELFKLPPAKKWCIIANYSDKTLLRNAFASYLGTEVLNAEWNPHFEQADVIFGGEYFGTYILGEAITLTKGRIGVQDIFDIEEYIKADHREAVEDSNKDGKKDLFDGGFILEVDSRMDADFHFVSEQGLPFCLKQTPAELSEEIQKHVQDIVQNAENILFSENFIENWKKRIDVDSVIDWYLINEFCKNPDARSWSSIYSYYNPADEKLHFGPVWDFDLACGNTNENDSKYPEGWWVRNNVWISRMFEDESFVESVKNRWNEKKSELYEAVNSWLKSKSSEISVSAEYNFARWSILGKYVKPNLDGWEKRTTYQDEIDFMICWMSERYSWLDTAINEL